LSIINPCRLTGYGIVIQEEELDSEEEEIKKKAAQ
jgi:hypothetical protein